MLSPFAERLRDYLRAGYPALAVPPGSALATLNRGVPAIRRGHQISY
jgi:hypothetical protein